MRTRKHRLWWRHPTPLGPRRILWLLPRRGSLGIVRARSTALSTTSIVVLIVAITIGGRTISLEVIGALLRSVIRVPLSSSMRSCRRGSALHFSKTRFLQGKHRVGLEECGDRIAPTDQGSFSSERPKTS